MVPKGEGSFVLFLVLLACVHFALCSADIDNLKSAAENTVNRLREAEASENSLNDKRDWSGFNTWGKRWNNMASWGKRWNNLGTWGKRWNNMASWGKRNPNERQLALTDVDANKDKRDWSQLSTWGKRNGDDSKRDWQGFSSWGKRQSWSNFNSWGKRDGSHPLITESEITDRFLDLFDIDGDRVLSKPEMLAFVSWIRGQKAHKSLSAEQQH